MIELTEEQIYDYIQCPLRYDARYNLRIADKNHPSLSSLLTRVANSFLLALMNGKVLTTSQIKKKWDVICENHQDMMTPQKCLDGMGLLTKMYLWAENERLRVGGMNIPFTYSLLNHDPQIMVRGEITEAVIPQTKSSVELLKLDFSNKYPDQASLDMKLKFTLDWKVLTRQLPKDIELAGIRVHHVKTDKDWFTFRHPDDYARMNAALTNVSDCINKKLFYPRETVMCASCDMKMYCSAWRG